MFGIKFVIFLTLFTISTGFVKGQEEMEEKTLDHDLGTGTTEQDPSVQDFQCYVRYFFSCTVCFITHFTSF